MHIHLGVHDVVRYQLLRQFQLLQDVDALQDIPLDFPVETERVELTITSLYPGTTYQDAVISEILFY